MKKTQKKGTKKISFKSLMSKVKQKRKKALKKRTNKSFKSLMSKVKQQLILKLAYTCVRIKFQISNE